MSDDDGLVQYRNGDVDWTLPPTEQIQKMDQKKLHRGIHELIELVRRTADGKANPRGGMSPVLVSAQYLRDELARREQDRQAKIMTELTEKVKDYTVTIAIMTIAVALMSFVSMAAALWPLVHAH